jgi:pimeloyl-ACP methyl ester carboxylesterase
MRKIPVVLLPGFLCDGAVWESQIAALTTVADCTVLDWGTRDSLAAMAELVLQSAPPAFALAGHSMGGRVAFEVYRRAPERVTRLALLNTNYPPKPLGEAGETEARGRGELLELARAEGMRAMAKRWLEGMIPRFRQQDAALVERIIEMFERKTPDDFERQMRALLNRPDATGVLSQVRCPALILTGAGDAWSPPAAHERMHAAIAGSRLVIVPECGHMSTMERPEEVTAALREWLVA